MDMGNEHVSQAMRRLDFSDSSDSMGTQFVDKSAPSGINNNHDKVLDKESLIHQNVPENMIPQIDMEFESEEAAYNFYNNYAKKVGFSIKRVTAHKSKGIIRQRVFSCSCQGRRGKDKRQNDVKRPRDETRFGCQAELRVTARLNGRFRVYKFVSEHTHGLVTPRKSHMLRSHRKIKEVDKVQLGMADSVGIPPKQSIYLLAIQVGGRENVGFIPEDYRNYFRTKRTMQMQLGDTGGVLEYMQKMHDEDPNFSCAIQVDCDDLITNIFWADAKMKLDYGYFGDVVCFDTTYRKNKEGRPLALFVGVNHHRQTIFFGGALLYDETAETFEWLFRSFAEVMSDKKPKTILTDDCQAMAKALKSSWPETFHRLCVWHMYQNAAKHLHDVFSCHKSFVKDFSSCIYDHDVVPDFLDAWEEMLAKYGLETNEWLSNLFANKEKWALVYGRQTFCADMSTTQRSESINSHVKRYIDYKYELLRFFHHFQRLVEDRRYEELRADFKASQSTPALEVSVEILKQAESIYTPTVFNIFRQQLWKIWDYSMDVCIDDGTYSEYKVRPFGKSYEHMVTFDSSNCKVRCSCMKFEFSGILCAHALKVFSVKNVQRIPEEYILKRWTKDAKVGGMIATCKPNVLEDPKIYMRNRFKELSVMFNQLSAKAAESRETYDIAREGCLKMIEDVEVKLASLKINSSNGHTSEEPNPHFAGASISGGIRVKGVKPKPKTVRAGGKRIKNALEKAFASKRPRMQKKPSRKSELSQQQEHPSVATMGGLDSFGNMSLPNQTTTTVVHRTFTGAEELHHAIDLNMEPMTYNEMNRA